MKTTHTHTPAPWKLGKVLPGAPGTLSGTRIVKSPRLDCDVCYVHPSSDKHDKSGMAERDANARLIAAAPELLKVVLQTERRLRGTPFGAQAREALQKAGVEPLSELTTDNGPRTLQPTIKSEGCA